MNDEIRIIRIGVTGGRDYLNKSHVWEVLDENKAVIEDAGHRMFLVVGDAMGADAFARYWASENDIDHQIFRADWTTHKKAAGPIRNKAMLESGIDRLCAFPGGRGTEHMKTICRDSGVNVIEYYEL